jgi:hypothetical protein
MKCFRHEPGKICPDCGLDRREVVEYAGVKFFLEQRAHNHVVLVPVEDAVWLLRALHVENKG